MILQPPDKDSPNQGYFSRIKTALFGKNPIHEMKKYCYQEMPGLYMSYIKYGKEFKNQNMRILFHCGIFSGFFDSYTRLNNDMQIWQKLEPNDTWKCKEVNNILSTKI